MWDVAPQSIKSVGLKFADCFLVELSARSEAENVKELMVPELEANEDDEFWYLFFLKTNRF